MEREVARQWEMFQATGLECRFINSHHHLHAHPFVQRALRRVMGDQFQGWPRLGRPEFFAPRRWETPIRLLDAVLLKRRRRLSPWQASDSLWGLDRLFRMDAAEIRATLPGLPLGFHEFMFHPRNRTCPDTLCLLALNS